MKKETKAIAACALLIMAAACSKQEAPKDPHEAPAADAHATADPHAADPPPIKKTESADEAAAAPTHGRKAEAFALSDSGFSIRAAGEPQCQRVLSYGAKSTICFWESDGASLMASATEMPEAPANGEAAAIANAIKGASESLSGQSEAVSDISFEGAKGRQYSIKTSDGVASARIFIKGRWLLQAIGLPKKGSETQEAADFSKSLAPAAAPKTSTEPLPEKPLETKSAH